ncbi:MAG: hypothetical protein R2800_02655 [Flavipsychrobacter sp.]
MAEEITADSGLTEPVQESKKEDSKSYHKYLVQLKELLPILSVILVFLGYWNLDSYYDHFDIDIYNYVTATELLLSFLPIIKYIIISVSLISVFVVILSSLIKSKKGKKSVKPTANILFTPLLLRRLYKIRKKRKSSLFTITINTYKCLLNLFVIVVPVFLTFLICDVLENEIISILFDKWTKYFFVFLIATTITYYSLIFNDTIFSRINLDLRDYTILFLSLNVILAVIIITSVINTLQSKRVYYNNNLKTTSILIDNKTITTDSNLVYIGQTQNYIFLRKLKEEVNVIYKMSDIDKLEIEGKTIK